MENEVGALRLKSDAVPTIFVFKPKLKKRKHSLERAAKNEKRRVCFTFKFDLLYIE